MKKRFYKFGYCVLRVGLLCGIVFGAIGCAHKDKAELQETAGRQSDQERETTRASISEKYPNANDRMVYLPMEDGTIQQWSLDGVYQQSFSLSAEEFMASDLLWVNNEELIWRRDEKKYRQSVQSTPIRRTESGEEVVLEQTKELFRVDSAQDIRGACVGGLIDATGTVYADQNRLFYLSEGAIYVYDRQSGGKPEKIKSSKGKTVSFSQYALSLASEMTKDKIIYHTGREAGTLAEDAIVLGRRLVYGRR